MTQYALLGFGSAMRCGIKIPPGYVRNLVDFVRDRQAQDGPEVKRVVDYQPGKRASAARRNFTRHANQERQKRAGWAYTYTAI